MSDFLDSMAGYMSIGEEKFENPEFENKLSYYTSLNGVSVDPQISSLYNRAVNRATSAARTAKSNKSSMKSLHETIEGQKDNLADSKERLRETYHRLREARKEHESTLPFSRKAHEANKKIKDLQRQFKTGNERKRALQTRIKENQTRLGDKKKEIAVCEQTVSDMKTYRDNLIAGVEKQFELVTRMQATLEHIKTMNFPQGMDLGKINNFLHLAKGKIAISLTHPLTNSSNNELTQAFNECFGSLQPGDKQQISNAEHKKLEECKDYIKALENLKLPEPDRTR